MADETRVCLNCKRDISAANFVMHEVHCRRHIVLCDHCGEPIHRSELEQHFNDHHAQIPCEKCHKMVSKSDMSKHLTEECSRKLMRCEYCELSLHKNEMEAHVDYCGSRTECCPLCQQYIMQKDKLRHESSGCTYPEPKPQPVDPYSLGELEQMMTNAVLGNNNLTGAYFRPGKIPTNKKSELNAQRAKNVCVPEIPDESLNTVSSDVDYDTMLALQLAHEDWFLDGAIESHEHDVGRPPSYSEESHYGFEEFAGLLDNGGKLWSDLMPPRESVTTNVNSRVAEENDEDMSIPCEFCEAVIPLSVYIVHMDSCPGALQEGGADLNNEHVAVPQITTKTTIPVINNLRPSDSPPPYQLLDDYAEDSYVMLPCEFCQESFPSDVIIQHQSVCQADKVVTPRSLTPVRNCRKIKPQQSSSQTSFKSTARSPPKWQQAPTAGECLVQDDSVSRDLTNIRALKFNESSSNKYSPAYNRFDDAITRPPRRSTRQPVCQNSVDSLEPRTESKSVQRTRASLNQLLQEETNAETLDNGFVRQTPATLGSSDVNRTDPKERRTRVDSRIVMRRLEERNQKTTLGSSNRGNMSQNVLTPGHGDQAVQSRQRTDRTDSWTMRRLEERNHKPTLGSSNKGSMSQNVLTPGHVDQAALTQTRQRTDRVFSPELRLKPGNSSPPKKR
ncbi:hypothetical protein BsWGS_21985 [Bradybaena similaris]